MLPMKSSARRRRGDRRLISFSNVKPGTFWIAVAQSMTLGPTRPLFIWINWQCIPFANDVFFIVIDPGSSILAEMKNSRTYRTHTVNLLLLTFNNRNVRRGIGKLSGMKSYIIEGNTNMYSEKIHWNWCQFYINHSTWLKLIKRMIKTYSYSLWISEDKFRSFLGSSSYS